MNTMLHIHPKDPLMDEKVYLSISGLDPTQPVTISCRLKDEGCFYVSYAHFTTSIDGTVNVSEHGSFGGSYVGVDTMGLFWSMQPRKGQKIGLIFRPKDVTKPATYTLKVYKGHLNEEECPETSTELNVSKTAKLLFESEFLKYWCGPGVSRHEVYHKAIRGTIFKPEGPGPFKGVIDIYGSGGGITEGRAALLASHGFIAFVLPHHRYQDLPRRMEEVRIEYLTDAIDYFASLQEVKQGIALVGFSLGAWLVLLLSILNHKVSAVVSIGTPPYMVTSVIKDGKKYPPTEEQITGEKYQLPLALSYPKDKHGGELLNVYVYDERTEHLTLEIQKSDAKFLIVLGEDDKLLNAVKTSEQLHNQMRKHKKEKYIQQLIYPKSGHFIDPPYLPYTPVFYDPHPALKRTIAIGGEMIEHSAACVHAWGQILKFISENAGLRYATSKL